MKKKLTRYLKIRTRNVTTKALEHSIVTSKRAVYRAGSFTATEDIFKGNTDNVIEINTVKACKISNDKLEMKKAFEEYNKQANDILIPTAEWANGEDLKTWETFPAIIKHVHSSGGKGIYYIKDEETLAEFILNHKDLDRYIIERYYTYSKEYRVHVGKDGAFHAIRKMLKGDATERWHRHLAHCVAILPENESFTAPHNWEAICDACTHAIAAVGLDLGAVDVKVQTTMENPKFIILETNSAPSLGELTLDKYKEQLIKFL